MARRRASVLLEREAELVAIDDLLGQAAGGAGSAILVRGTAGIGKSALLDHARRRAGQRGVRVLTARGAAFERGYPFGVARQLLGTAWADPALREVMLAGAGKAAAAVLTADALAATVPDAAFSVTYGIYWAMSNLAAQQPLLICIDDIQWADDASLRMFDFVVRRVADASVGVIAALRSGEDVAEEYQGAFAELEATGFLHVLDPSPLSVSGALALARVVLGADVEPGFATACHAWTGGNPFFLGELLDELADEGVAPTAAQAQRVGARAPRNVSRIVLARLARLGPDAVALARAIAVLGDQAVLGEAADLAAVSRESAVTAADRLIATGVLRSGERLRFEHPLMRDAVEADMGAQIVSEYHARAADLLAAHGRDDEAVAAHVVLGPAAADRVAVERLQAAARIALARAAPEEAVTLLTRALAEPPPPELARSVLLELGTAELAARRPEAFVHLSQAREQSRAGVEQAEVALLLSRLLLFAGQGAQALATIAEAQRGLTEADRELAYALEAVAITAAAMSPNGHRAGSSAADRFAGLPGATPGECAVLAGAAFQAARAGRPVEETMRLLSPLIDRAGFELVAGPADPWAGLMAIIVLHWSGRLARAAELTGVVLDRARAENSSMVFAEALASRANTYWRSGLIAEAEADARQALATEGFLLGTKSPVAVAALANVLVDRGEAAAARELIRESGALSGVGDLTVQEFVLTPLGRAEIALGRFDDALTHLLQAGEISTAVGVVNPAVSEWRLHAAEALLGLRRADEAREMLAPASVAARRSGGPIEMGTSLRVEALAERPVNLDLLGQAQRLLAASEVQLEHARVLVDLGTALRRVGARTEARARLAEAMELANRCGATGLVARARGELQATGARPRRLDRYGVDALTPSEQRVARFVAEGMSNREVAQHLFVSTRTVEAQLRSAYAKLGISSRQALPEALGKAR